jgi:hypothetical protein
MELLPAKFLNSTAVAVAVAVLALMSAPAQAGQYQSARHHVAARQHHAVARPRLVYAAPLVRPPTVYHGPNGSYPGPGNGPVWQGEPGDHLPIWRYGYYLGNDPDPRIRLELMRDPHVGRWGVF